MLDFAHFSAFEWVIFVCIFIMGGALASALLLALRSRDELTR